MSLSDADLDLMRRWASMSDPKRNGTMDWEAAIAELQDLRARVVGGTDGPDQGDPAAWTAGDDAVLWEGTRVELLYRHDEPSAWWVQRSDGHAYVAHERWLRAPGAVAAAPPGDDLTARLLDAFTRGDHDRHDSLYMEVVRALKAGARIVAAPVDPATRFRPGDFVTVADGATVGEYVGYEGGPFSRHRYRVVWPDGTRTPGVSAADDTRVTAADPAVLAEYTLAPTEEAHRG